MPIRRRPILRTAAVAGTATAVSKGVANKMDAKQEAQQQQSQQAAAAQEPVSTAEANAAGDDLIEQLSKLASLKEAGALTEEEFTAAKAKLLG